MPIVGQIQPSYLHPHVATYINDNTEFTDEAAAVADDSIKLFYVITSQKGRDNVFLTHTDQYEWLKEYGNPNINLYGQAGYMAHASLSTGECTVKTMRVMPEDATYANALIALKVKVDETSGKKLIVKHTCSFRDDVSDKGDVLAGLETLRDEEPDESGFITLPLAAIYCVGRGTYGNEFRVRIAQSLQMDRENDYKNCKVEILGTENGISSLGFFEGAIYDGALDGKRSIYIEDYVNDITTGSGHINMYIEPTTLDKFTQMYAEINPKANIKTIDVFGFLTKEAKELTGIEVDAETVILDGVEGIPLSGGSNGSFDNADATVRQAKINEVLVKAMKGEIDKSIKSRRRVPADVMLDCCYDAEVKRAMLDLANTRNSATFYMDAGKLTTTAQAIDWADEMKNLSPYLLSKNIQCYKIRDPFTYRPITVSITYLFATAIPMHFKDKGRHVPFAGANVKLTGHIKGSVLPVIDSDDSELKEELYTKRVNFFEAVSETVYQRGCQTTAQLKWSDLSEEHNVNELYDIKRTIEDYAATRIYNFAEVEDRNRFTEDAKALFANRIGTHLRSIDVSFEMNSWEEERSILHCYIGIVFKTIAKRIIIEIDVNKRV